MIYLIQIIYWVENIMFFRSLGRTRGRVVLAEPQVKLQLLQAETLLGVSGQTHFQEILAIWRERQKDEKLTATVMHQSVNYTMNWSVFFLLSDSSLLIFSSFPRNFVSLKSCTSVEQFKLHLDVPVKDASIHKIFCGIN